MLIPAAEADNGMYDGTDNPNWEEEEPGCKVDPDGLPRSAVEVESEPRHENSQDNQTERHPLLWPWYIDGLMHQIHTGCR